MKLLSHIKKALEDTSNERPVKWSLRPKKATLNRSESNPRIRSLPDHSITSLSPVIPESPKMRPDRDKLSMEGVLMQVENNGLGGISQQLEKNLVEIQRENLINSNKTNDEKSRLEKIFVPTAESSRSVQERFDAYRIENLRKIHTYFPINLSNNGSRAPSFRVRVRNFMTALTENF